MRTLKHKQYTHRYKQFMKTFESVFPMESDDYDMEAQIKFNNEIELELNKVITEAYKFEVGYTPEADDITVTLELKEWESIV